MLAALRDGKLSVPISEPLIGKCDYGEVKTLKLGEFVCVVKKQIPLHEDILRYVNVRRAVSIRKVIVKVPEVEFAPSDDLLMSVSGVSGIAANREEAGQIVGRERQFNRRCGCFRPRADVFVPTAFSLWVRVELVVRHDRLRAANIVPTDYLSQFTVKLGKLSATSVDALDCSNNSA